MSKSAAQAMSEYLAPCTHKTTSPVLSTDDQVMGELCSRCLLLLWAFGRCDGCGREKKLTVLVDSRSKRYCTNDCRLAAVKAAKEKP